MESVCSEAHWKVSEWQAASLRAANRGGAGWGQAFWMAGTILDKSLQTEQLKEIVDLGQLFNNAMGAKKISHAGLIRHRYPTQGGG